LVLIVSTDYKSALSEQSFNISINALTLALENHKDLEGDEKTRKDAITKIRTLS